MAEGLEVTIKYRGAKYDQVASPATASSEFAILKKDLAHLRVHSPSQKNVRRVGGSFILHWPMAGASAKVTGLPDSLYSRWHKLCSDDPEALKLREFLSIQSITLMQDGVLLRSTARPEQASQDAPPDRLGDPVPKIVRRPAPPSVPAPSLSVEPPPPVIPPPRVPPTAPRSDRQTPPHLKRRMSSADEGPSNSTRQKLDMPEAPATTPPQLVNNPLQPTQPTTTPPSSIDTQPQPTQPSVSPRSDRQRSSTPGYATKTDPQPQHTREADAALTAPPPEPHTVTPSPPREPGEMKPQPIRTPFSGSAPGLGPGSSAPTCPPPSPYASSSSSGHSDPDAPRRRDRDVNRLMHELWDTRRQLTAMQAREQVVLDDLERLGARPEGAGADRSGVSRDVLTEMLTLEAELRAERARRVRAERALSDVEQECRAPFIVPALFQAFMNISELSN